MTNDTDLIEQTKSALKSVGKCPWLPDLTDDLVKMGWCVLYRKAGLSPSDYGTSRVIARSAHAHRNLMGYLSSSLAIEILDENHLSYYEGAGIEFYTPTEIISANLLRCVEDALNLIKRVPTLYSTVADLVRCIHLIKPEDDDYDVSFSEPHIPFSIFVSVPQVSSLTNALRIAEAIAHEAMHLQLTLIEQCIPLVISKAKQYYSPWKKEYRDARGILHSLYVFRVIDRVLEQLTLIGSSTSDVTEYIHRRRYDISQQIREIHSFQHCPELTSVGVRFVQSII